MSKPSGDFAVLWDVDGTLVDTAQQHYEAWIALAAEIDKPFTRADFHRTFGWRNPEIIPLLFGAHLSAEEISRIGDRKESLYRKLASQGVELLPGVRSLLSALAAEGFRQAVGSSAPRANVDMILESAGIREFFAGAVTLEDTARGKPDPAVFLRAAEVAGVPATRCVVFEDAPVGVQAARAAGMKAVGVTFVGHHSEETLRSAGADHVTPSLETIDVAFVRFLIGAE